jgi:hypothetical protein
VEQLKKTLSNEMIMKMKKEYVDCPVAGQQVPFLLTRLLWEFFSYINPLFGHYPICWGEL